MTNEEIKTHSFTMVHFFGKEQRALVGAQKGNAEYIYIGYTLTLQWLTDARNFTWDEYACLAPTLEQMVRVLNDWLADGWSLSELIEKYQWMADDNS